VALHETAHRVQLAVFHVRSHRRVRVTIIELDSSIAMNFENLKLMPLTESQGDSKPRGVSR
jgi:hypothetical protein